MLIIFNANRNAFERLQHFTARALIHPSVYTMANTTLQAAYLFLRCFPGTHFQGMSQGGKANDDILSWPGIKLI